MLSLNDVNKSKDMMRELLPEAVKFIDECQESGGRAVVHCSAGISRSSTVVCAYLMAQGSTLLEAFRQVRAKRRWAYPNRAFWDVLLELDEDTGSIPQSVIEMHVHKDAVHLEPEAVQELAIQQGGIDDGKSEPDNQSDVEL